MKSISPSSPSPSISTNSPAKNNNVPHSTLCNTPSSSCISANNSSTNAPNMAIQPVEVTMNYNETSHIVIHGYYGNVFYWSDNKQ